MECVFKTVIKKKSPAGNGRALRKNGNWRINKRVKIKSKKDKSKAISIYRDLLVEGSEPVQLVGMLANQFRLLSEVSYLSTQYSSNNEIARILGVHEYRVKLSRDHLRRITYKKILKKIDELYQLDLDIKSGVVDRFFAFEMFLIRF